MGCCGCFGFLRKHNNPSHSTRRSSQECLLPDNMEDMESLWAEASNALNGKNEFSHTYNRSAEEILMSRIQNGLLCRQVPVKETTHVTRTEDEDGKKKVNEYVRERKIGAGSYGKVILYRNTIDQKRYAIKVFHKSHLLKLRVAPSETAMSDVLKEVCIMKMLDHPNIVNLIEVIDDPNTDHFYMVLEYVESKWVCEGTGPQCSLGEDTSRRYLRDIVAGVMYLHAHNIIHGDIKPDNLLVTSNGRVKIGDFSVSQVFEDDNDELRRSPGTPVFTAPECCLGLTYHGRAADTWAVGITLYCMVFGQYPFLGDTLQDTYDKIVNAAADIPVGTNPSLKNLLEGLLCKDPGKRMSLRAIAEHPWVVGDDGAITEYLCRCRRKVIEQKNLLKMGKMMT